MNSSWDTVTTAFYKKYLSFYITRTDTAALTPGLVNYSWLRPHMPLFPAVLSEYRTWHNRSAKVWTRKAGELPDKSAFYSSLGEHQAILLCTYQEVRKVMPLRHHHHNHHHLPPSLDRRAVRALQLPKKTTNTKGLIFFELVHFGPIFLWSLR